ELAKIVANTVKPDEKVYLFGLSSSIYALADRLPPKRWTDNFSWYLEIPGVQEEVISRWNNNTPQFIFWRTSTAGNQNDLGTYQPRKIVEWIKAHYTNSGEVKSGITLW